MSLKISRTVKGDDLLKRVGATESDVIGCFPDLTKRYETVEQRFQSALADSGDPLSLLSAKSIHRYSQQSEKLREFLYLGSLELREEFFESAYAEAGTLLERKKAPALLRFRDLTLINFFYDDLREDLEESIQLIIAQQFCNLESSLYDFTIIDTRHFGERLKVLQTALSKANVLSDTSEISSFFDLLVDELKLRIGRKGLYDYVYQYNEANTDSPIKYSFVLIYGSFDEFTEEQLAVLSKLIDKGVGARAGVYISFVTSDILESKRHQSCYPDQPRLVIYSKGLGNIQVYCDDCAGLNTFKNGKFQHLNIHLEHYSKEDLHLICESIRRNRLIETRRSVALTIGQVEPKTETKVDKLDPTDGIRVPIGKASGDEIFLELGGSSDNVHALVGGSTGTGKSNLLHVILLKCIETYSDSLLKISILDFKNGTEFQEYIDVPHLFAISLGSKVQFGSNVLKFLEKDIEERAKLFKSLGVNELSQYNRTSKTKLPRHLIIIDEFQALFVEDSFDSCQSLLEKLIRTGRSYGYNFILSSQSLRGKSLSPTTAANISVRLCLRLHETECGQFLSYSNFAPSKLRRTGHAIYNDRHGENDGNQEFTVYHMARDSRISYLKGCCVGQSNAQRRIDPPYVYLEDCPAKRADLPQIESGNKLLIGYVDRIPKELITSSLDPSSGILLVLGRSWETHPFFENLNFSLSASNCRYRLINGVEESESYILSLDRQSRDAVDCLVMVLSSAVEFSSPIVEFLKSPNSYRVKKLVLISTNYSNFEMILDFSTSIHLEGTVCLDSAGLSGIYFGRQTLASGFEFAYFPSGGTEPEICRVPLS